MREECAKSKLSRKKNLHFVVLTWTTSPDHQINATLKHFSNGSTMRVSIPRDAG